MGEGFEAAWDRIVATAATPDPDRIERDLWHAYERHVRYEGDDRRATSREAKRIVLRFATRASGDPSLAVGSEIRIELP